MSVLNRIGRKLGRGVRDQVTPDGAGYKKILASAKDANVTINEIQDRIAKPIMISLLIIVALYWVFLV